jgi:hypothetical protein
MESVIVCTYNQSQEWLQQFLRNLSYVNLIQNVIHFSSGMDHTIYEWIKVLVIGVNSAKTGQLLVLYSETPIYGTCIVSLDGSL